LNITKHFPNLSPTGVTLPHIRSSRPTGKVTVHTFTVPTTVLQPLASSRSKKHRSLHNPAVINALGMATVTRPDYKPSFWMSRANDDKKLLQVHIMTE